jgi:branched-chain amino acid transport system permease protein
MLGGYVSVVLMLRLGVPFLLALPLAFLAAAAAGAVLERTLYRRFYGASHLDQVLFSIGLTLMSVAGATYVFGSGQQPVRLPSYLIGQVHAFGVDFGVYRLFLIAVVVVVAGALVYLTTQTRFGAQVRASVDNATVSAGVGINVSRVFSVTFALGSGLAGFGGALGIDVLGLEPNFPFHYLVYFLLVVAVGGAGTIGGALGASMLLGICDVAGKYYIPDLGAFVIYALMVAMLLASPTGLARRTR